MSTLKVTPDTFTIAMSNLLDEYSQEMADAVYESADEVSNEAVNTLKGTKKRPTWKKFPSGWKRTITRKSFGSTEAIVHLKSPQSRIGHLLEFDHASRGGGRTVDGYDFIRPVAEQAAEDFENKIIQKIGEK